MASKTPSQLVAQKAREYMRTALSELDESPPGRLCGVSKVNDIAKFYELAREAMTPDEVAALMRNMLSIARGAKRKNSAGNEYIPPVRSQERAARLVAQIAFDGAIVQRIAGGVIDPSLRPVASELVRGPAAEQRLLEAKRRNEELRNGASAPDDSAVPVDAD